MPCCLSIMMFSCGHSRMYKLDCTDNCDGLCPRDKQDTLCNLKYKWQCEECHQVEWNKKEDERTEHYEAEEIDVTISDISNLEKAGRVSVIRMKETVEDEQMAAKRIAQAEEIQSACEFAEQYGRGLWTIKYGPKEDKAEAERRITCLREAKAWDLELIDNLTGNASKMHDNGCKDSEAKSSRGTNDASHQCQDMSTDPVMALTLRTNAPVQEEARDIGQQPVEMDDRFVFFRSMEPSIPDIQCASSEGEPPTSQALDIR